MPFDLSCYKIINALIDEKLEFTPNRFDFIEYERYSDRVNGHVKAYCLILILKSAALDVTSRRPSRPYSWSIR